MQVFLQGHTTERYCLLGERDTVVCFRIANIFKTHLRVIYYAVESLSSLAWIMRKKSGCFFLFSWECLCGVTWLFLSWKLAWKWGLVLRAICLKNTGGLYLPTLVLPVKTSPKECFMQCWFPWVLSPYQEALWWALWIIWCLLIYPSMGLTM